MSRIRFGRIAAAGLAVALTFAAATHVRADAKEFNAIEAAITKSHHIPLNAGNYTQRAKRSTVRRRELCGPSTLPRISQVLRILPSP